MQGTDMAAIEAVRQATKRHLTAAGGITTLEEVEALDRLGVDAVVGMALYTGRIALPERPISRS
jgi:phosphoribosylformimino-5-aminoimidazole carboxamide ribonucleotide (ProFAR) isomerase